MKKIKYPDLCDFNGKYQGAIYIDCNLRLALPWQLICVITDQFMTFIRW